MFYITRHASGRLLRVESEPFEGMQGSLAADSLELQQWRADQDAEQSLLQLRQSDQEVIRVLDDLVSTLINKGVLSITDLPEAAQQKLMDRIKVRESLEGSSNRLLSEDDNGVI